RSLIFAAMTLAFGVIVSFSQAPQTTNSNIVKKELSQAEIDRIIKKVTANEGDFRSALTSYVFNRYATVQIIGMGGQVAGTYRRDSFMTFTQDGGRFEKVLYAPVETTPPGFVTPEDLEDLGGVNPFALEPSSISQYNFAYVGVEKIDELNLYVFDVTPKVIPDPKKSKLRLFTGRVWIDTDDLMIVKSKGKAVPETKVNKFPIVETTREQVDGKYWFPSDARSDDELVFDNGNVTKIRMRVKFSDYKVGRSEVRILDDVPDKPTPTPTPKKPE
ncbi:MAG: hypothetical protein ABJB40_01040, partial [Acidobacteriota bacterium]